jgi:hypothetical protein
MAPKLGFNYSHLQNEDKECSVDVEVRKQLIWRKVIEEKNIGVTTWLGPTGGARPISKKQHKFDPTVWKTCLRLLMEDQSKIMLKLIHKRMEFPNF